MPISSFIYFYFFGGLSPISPPGPSPSIPPVALTVFSQLCFEVVPEFEGDTKPINKKKIILYMIQKF